MQVRVLGPVEVLGNGAVSLGGRKQRTVLALLVARAGTIVSVDALIDGVWGDEPTPAARSTLQTYVSNLRGAIGDTIVREGGGYRLDIDPRQVDAFSFEEAVARAGELVENHPAEAAQRLRAALALWRGHPYTDVSDSFPLELEARRLDDVRLGAVELRIEAELALGHHAALVPELEVLCSEFPYREGFRVQHMLALYRSGRQAEALRAFQKTRGYLADELGLDPSPELRALEGRILNQDESLLLDVEPRIERLAFLLADIEGDELRSAVGPHYLDLREAVDAAGGRIVEHVGEGFYGVFADVRAALAAAERMERHRGPVAVAIAIDVGDVESGGGDYSGPVLNRARRLLASGHGGQVLLSADAHATLAATESGWQAKALGEHRFVGIDSPVNVFQLLLDGAPADFPPLRVDRLPPALPAPFGRSVRGYELREEIGSGDFGIVYRGYQPSVGREVAIKVIRPDLVNEPSFVRRFEADARRVAQLEHPHIASLHDYWRDPEGAYLVMRWLRGGSLAKALERGPWSARPAMMLLEQLGEALSYAHRQGVVHGDLKPANVLLDEEGYAYLSDFKIAAAAAPDAIRSDVCRLGLLMFELFGGRAPPIEGALPALSELRSELPGDLDTVIATATAADPERRYGSVDALLAAAGEALGSQPAKFTETRNPYKGLRAFEEADAEDFFGRRSLVAELVAAVADHRLVAVVGPSGIGKSSVVKGGLIPALRRGALPRSDSWLATEMLPGSYPFEELAAALLRVAVEDPRDLVEELARDELGIARTAKRILSADSELLLVIDQFEELFTLTTDEDARRRFLDGLTALVSDPRARARVVLALRGDFLDHPLRYPEFGKLLRAGMVVVTSPSEDELAEAIERPAARTGVRFERGLVSQIIADVADEPGALPLLQYALTEVFAARTSDLLTLDGYRATGGVVGALGRRAEELYEQLGRTRQAAARQVFLRLVAVDPQAHDTRRRVRRRELRRLELDPTAVDEILVRYGKHRLLTFDHEPLTRSPTVEIAHEALLTQWERLRLWVDERRGDLLHHRRLVEAVGEWEESARAPDYLPRAGRLAQFEDLAAGTDLALTAGEREFIAESRAAAERAVRRRTGRRRAILAGFALFAVAASALAVIAFVQRGRAERQARLSNARAYAAAAQDAVDEDPELGLLLALEGVKATRSAGEPVIREVVEALHAAVNAQRIVRRIPNDAELVAWSPDGKRLVISRAAEPEIGDAFAAVVDASTGAQLSQLRRRSGDGRLTGVSFDPSGRWLVTTHEGRATTVLWDGANGRRAQTLRGHGRKMFSPVFTQDGRKLAVSNLDGTVSVWGLASGAELHRIRGVRTGTLAVGEGRASSGAALIDFSPDGRLLATAEPGLPGAVIRRSRGGRPLHVLETPPSGGLTFSVAFSPTGDHLAVLEEVPGFVDIFDVGTGKLLRRHQVGASLMSLDWSPDGARIAVGGNDAVVTLVDPVTGVSSRPLRGHAEPVTAVAFSPDGTRLASAGWRASTLVWDLSGTGRGELGAYPGDLGTVLYTFPDPGGRRIYAASMEGTVNVVDTVRDTVVGTIPHQLVDFRVGIALSRDGRWLATTGTNGVTRIRDSGTLRTRHQLPRGFHVKSFSPDGARVLVGITAPRRGPPRVLEVATGRTVFRLDGSGPIEGVEWSPDGTLLATASFDAFARVYDGRSGDQLIEMPFDRYEATDVSFRPDGSQLAISSHDVVIVDAAALRARRVEVVATLPNRSGAAEIQSIQFTQDGSELVTSSVSLELGVWDASSWEPKYTIRGEYATPSMSLLESERGVVSAGLGSPGLVVHTLDVDRLVEIARERLTRTFTSAECVRYLETDDCPSAG